MQYISTQRQSKVPLAGAVACCYAPDGGLYLPERLPLIPKAFFNNIEEMSLAEIGYVVARTLLADEAPAAVVKAVADEAFNFPVPLVSLDSHLRLLELFNGPTLAFKDISARFMAACLRHRIIAPDDKPCLVMVATTGNTGAAVAKAFERVPGIEVLVLYPRNALSPQQTVQFAAIGANVHAIEVAGSITDCKAMVRAAVTDPELAARYTVVSANTHNIMRILPQVATFFHAYGRLRAREPRARIMNVAIPCGNLSNLVSAVMARRMGCPIGHIVAGCSINDSLVRVLDGSLSPDHVTAVCHRTLARAMDSGYPTNLPRLLSLYDGDPARIAADGITAVRVDDDTIARTLTDIHAAYGYTADPHTAVAVAALQQVLPADPHSVVMATAHPAKSLAEMERILGRLPRELTVPPSIALDAPQAIAKIAPSLPALKRYISTNL